MESCLTKNANKNWDLESNFNIDTLILILILTSASHKHPNRGSDLQPMYVPRLGIEDTTFWYMGQPSNQVKHPARAALQDFEITHICPLSCCYCTAV